MRVGFIGLGNMGGPLAAFVLRAGHALVVHDIRRETATHLVQGGAAWADSPGDVAAASDIICVCVPGPPEMEAVTLGPRGIVERVTPGSVVIDHTTNAPDVVRT